MPKERFDIRISADLRRRLDDQAAHHGGITALAERYFEEGLARESGELVEQSSLPAIREAVRSEFNACMDQLYERLSRDLQQSARKSDERLAALIIKAARSAGITQRMLFSLTSKLVSNDFALKVWDAASEQTSKALAKSE